MDDRVSPDTYTTTADPLRPLICSRCRGHFSGTNKNLFVTDDENHYLVILCDNCRRERGYA